MVKRPTAVLLATLCCAIVNAQSVGSRAPLFSGKTADQKEIRLIDFTGKVVLVDIWASWCGPCKQEMPFLVELDNAFRDSGLVILAVNIDKDPKNAATFLSGLKTRPAFLVIMDKEARIPPLYKLEGMPTTVLVDRKGFIRFRHTGFKPEKKPEYRNEIKELLDEK